MRTAMQFNQEQLNIIDADLSNNILVSAAAGSGKTTVLTERIVRKIIGENCNGKDINLSNVLVMTFTKKATAEMKARIKQKLEEKLLEGVNAKKLYRESAMIQNANISTIDSFCKRVLEENYTLLDKKNSLYYDFDLTYRIGDDKEMAVLKEDVLDDFFEKQYADAKYKTLFDLYVNKNDEASLKNMLIAGLTFLTSVTWPEEYLSDRIKNFEYYSKKAYEEYICVLSDKVIELQNESLKKVEIASKLYDIYKSSLDGGLTASNKPLSKDAIDAFNNTLPIVHSLIDLMNSIANEKIVIDDGKNAKTIDENSLNNIINLKNEFLGMKKLLYMDVRRVARTDKEEHNEIKSELNSIIEKFDLLDRIYNAKKIDTAIIYNENDKLFLEFLREFYLQVIYEKKKRNMYEISDYAHISLDILYDKIVDKDGKVERIISDRAKKIGDRYELIFVDEYQDTNFVQEKILAALSNDFKKNNVFMVGDVKQSIYGFRNAEPSIFVNKQKEYRDNACGVNKTLSVNYRSTKEIISYVNDLFAKTMTLDFGDIDYSNGNALDVRDDEKDRELQDDKKVEIHVVYKDDENAKDKVKDDKADNGNTETDSEEQKNSMIECEADYVATEIEKLVKEKKCKYSDIVILLRSVKNKGKVFEEALRRHKIPSYSEQRTGFFEKVEIKLMLEILAIIDNPLQNIAFAAVLESNIFNFKHDELAFMRIISDKEYLYDALSDIVEMISEKDRKAELSKKLKDYSIDVDKFIAKVERFFDTLSDLQFKLRYLSISDFIEYIYDKLMVREIVSAMSDGRQRKANLDTLYDFALNFENSNYVSLFNFNRYVKKMKDVSIDQGQAKIYDENSDVVRIMTLHTSKGLQFNTVFLCNCNAKYNDKDYSDRKEYQFDKDYGIGLDYYDKAKNYVLSTPKKILIVDKKRNDMLREELRMLYVALTRAENKLYITGSVCKNTGFGKTDFDNFNECYANAENISKSIKDCDCYLDVVLANYPVKDESYCKLVLNSWDINVEDKPDSDTIYDEVYNDVRDEKKVIEANKDYFADFDKDSIDNSLKDSYKYGDYNKLKPKFSVSAIKKVQIDKEFNRDIESKIVEDDDRDDARVDKKHNDTDIIDGREIGNAYHRFMQFYNYNDNAYQCDKEADSNVQNIVDNARISAFLDSSIGKEMAIAYKNQLLYREQKFMKLYSQSEINDYMKDDFYDKLDIKTDILSEKNVIIQGVIDAFYIKKDTDGSERIVLVDYKTDSLSKKSIDREKTINDLKNHYKIQLDIYADAIKELTGLEVKEKYLYSFALNEAVMV